MCVASGTNYAYLVNNESRNIYNNGYAMPQEIKGTYKL